MEIGKVFLSHGIFVREIFNGEPEIIFENGLNPHPTGHQPLAEKDSPIWKFPPCLSFNSDLELK